MAHRRTIFVLCFFCFFFLSLKIRPRSAIAYCNHVQRRETTHDAVSTLFETRRARSSARSQRPISCAKTRSFFFYDAARDMNVSRISSFIKCPLIDFICYRVKMASRNCGCMSKKAAICAKNCHRSSKKGRHTLFVC